MNTDDNRRVSSRAPDFISNKTGDLDLILAINRSNDPAASSKAAATAALSAVSSDEEMESSPEMEYGGRILKERSIRPGERVAKPASQLRAGTSRYLTSPRLRSAADEGIESSPHIEYAGRVLKEHGIRLGEAWPGVEVTPTVT